MKQIMAIVVVLFFESLAFGQTRSIFDNLSGYITPLGNHKTLIKSINNYGYGYYVILDSNNSITERGVYKNEKIYFKYEYLSDTIKYENQDSAFCSLGQYTLVVKSDNFNIHMFSPAEYIGDTNRNDSVFQIVGYITKEKYFDFDSAKIFQSLKEICEKNNYQILDFNVVLNQYPETVLFKSFSKIDASTNMFELFLCDGESNNIEDFSIVFSSRKGLTSSTKTEVKFVDRKPKFLYDCKVVNFMQSNESEVCDCYHFNESGTILQKFSFLNGALVSFYYSEIGREKRVAWIINKKNWLPDFNGIWFPSFYQFDNNGEIQVLKEDYSIITLHPAMFFQFCSPSKTTIWHKKLIRKHHCALHHPR